MIGNMNHLCCFMLVSQPVSQLSFIPQFQTLVSQPISYPGFIWRFLTCVSYPGFIAGFIFWFHTFVWRLGFIAGFISISYPFYIGFTSARAIVIQCSCHSFVGCDGKETNSVSDVVVPYWLSFHTGFIPVSYPVAYPFHTGFIPVSYRFHSASCHCHPMQLPQLCRL